MTCDKCGTILKNGKFSKYCPNCNHSYVGLRGICPHGHMHNFGKVRR